MDTKALSVVFGDRDLEWSRSLRSDLRSDGMQVSAATSTHEVLAMAERHAPDVIIVDESLEELGREILVRLIRDRSPGAKVILILPEDASMGEADRCRLGLQASFARPVALKDLHSAICATERGSASGRTSSKPPLIMCVDDEPDHLKSLMRVLRRRGFSVVGFHDSEQALEAIPVARPDLIFLDVLMPGMNGLDLAEEVREQFADAIPLVLLTGRSSDHEIAEGYRKGATHYITKPCDPRTIVSVAEFLLGDPRVTGEECEPQEPRISTSPDREDPFALVRRHVVICVDDEPQILSSLRRLLRNEPYEVLTTDRPEEVLDWVGKRDVSLVISDQRMPEMLGTQLLEEVSRRSPVTARILLTGYPGSTVRIQGLKQGIELLLYKPWDDAIFKGTIRRLLHDREARGERPVNAPEPHPGPEDDRR